MTVVTLPSAKEDLADGVVFYESQGIGLGTYQFDDPAGIGG